MNISKKKKNLLLIFKVGVYLLHQLALTNHENLWDYANQVLLSGNQIKSKEKLGINLNHKNFC